MSSFPKSIEPMIRAFLEEFQRRFSKLPLLPYPEQTHIYLDGIVLHEHIHDHGSVVAQFDVSLQKRLKGEAVKSLKINADALGLLLTDHAALMLTCMKPKHDTYALEIFVNLAVLYLRAKFGADRLVDSKDVKLEFDLGSPTVERLEQVMAFDCTYEGRIHKVDTLAMALAIARALPRGFDKAYYKG